MDLAEIHISKRKRIHQKKEKFPSPNKKIKFLDNLIYFIGVLGPVLTLPQFFKIINSQSSQGVSLISWSSYLVMATIWLIYGIVHKDRHIITAYSGWVVVELMVVIAIVLY